MRWKMHESSLEFTDALKIWVEIFKNKEWCDQNGCNISKKKCFICIPLDVILHMFMLLNLYHDCSKCPDVF